MRVQVEGDKLLIGWYTFFLKVEIVSMATARMECCSGISDLRIVGRSSDYIHYRNCQKDVARVLLNYREGFLDLFNRDGKVLVE